MANSVDIDQTTTDQLQTASPPMLYRSQIERKVKFHLHEITF